MTNDDWVSLCELAELEPLWGEAALLGDHQVALFLLPDGTLHAVSNRCPATGAYVMSRGIVGSKGARSTIASPLHKQVYDLVTGECLSSADYLLATYPVRVDGGVVQVALAETVPSPNYPHPARSDR
ncbi:MAG: nitrite reductase small subunit NirD [Actinomycetota bacterium]